MNRLFLALILGATFFCGQASAQADRQALSGYCEDGGQTVTSAGVTSATKVQRSYPGCTVTVYVSGTATLATIYADLAGTPKANPFTANGTTGYWFFYADPARFDVQLSGAGMSTTTRGGLWIVASGGGGGGVTGSGTTNTVPKWTSSTALGDSIITEVGGTQTRVGGDLLVTGVAGFGVSPSSSNSITVSKTFSSVGSYNGILTDTILQSINGVGSSYAGRFVLTTSGSTVNATDLGGLRVVQQHTGFGNLSENYGIYSTVSQSGAGTLTDPIGIRSDLSLGLSSSNQLTNYKATGTLSAGTHQQYIDFLSKPPTLSGGAAITNMYGFAAFSAPSVVSGITNYYPFYSIQGIASFGNGASSDRLELRSGLPLRLWNPTDLGYSEIVQNATPAANYRYYWPSDAPATSDALTVTGVSGSNVTLAWTPGGGGAATNVRKALNVVTDYGCAGDGVTNDTTCISNALTAAAAAGGYKVYLPAGTYLVTGLTFTGQIEIEGDGDGKTIIYSTTNAPIVNVDPNGSFRGPTIRNLTIRGSVSAGGSQIGLNVDDATYVHSVRVSNVTIENTGDYGLYVGNAFSSTFENMFISNTADYPLLYNASQMPQNRFESIYIGDLRSGVTSGFRIKAGAFHCTNCNGVNTVVANSWWATLGKKAGTDGDVSNGSAYAHWDGGNAESTVAGGIRHYYNSQSTVGPGFQFAGDASGSGTYIAMLYEVDSAIFPPQFSKGVISDKVVFANSPASFFANSQPIQSNDIPPVMIEGQGPRVAGGDNVLSYYDSTKTKALPLTSSGGFFETYEVTATANGVYDRPGVRMIKADCAAACTVEIPWPGWYRAGEYLTIYDASGAAATNNVTVNVGSGGTINGGASYTINRDLETITLVPDESGTNWVVVTNYPGGKVPSIQGGGTPNLDFYPTWSSTQGILSLSSGIYNLSGQTVFTNDVLANTDNADDIGTSGGNRFRTIYAATGFSGPKYTVAGNIFWSSGAGSPEGAVTADIGSIYSRNNGSSNTTIYAKTSGGGNTGWEPLINTGGGGGSIGGTIAANQVAFGTAADTIGGDNDLQWDNSTKNLTVVGHAAITQDNTATVPFSVQAVAASSAELAQFKDSGGNVRGGYSTAGAFFFRGFSSAPTASLANDGKLFYDITGGVTNQQLLLSKNTGTYNPVVTAEQASFTVNRLVKWSNTAGSWQATDISGATSDGTNVTFGSANLRATRPRFITSIDDSNGNELLLLTATGSAVNEITIANAASGNSPSLTSSGGGTDIDLILDGKGTGLVRTSASNFQVNQESTGVALDISNSVGAPSSFDNWQIRLYTDGAGAAASYGIGVEASYLWLHSADGIKLYGSGTARWIMNASSFAWVPSANNTYDIGDATRGVRDIYLAAAAGRLVTDDNNTVVLLAGSGSPEGAITAGVGSLYQRNDGGSNTTIYAKTSGAGNTGWSALLNSASGGGYDTIQEEGSDLTQRTKLNFVGAAATAADDAGNSRTNVTFDADLNALASNATTGFWVAGTGAARTLTGTANQIVITNGDGSGGNPTFQTPQNLDTSALFQVGALGVGTTAPSAGGIDLLGKAIDSTTASNTIAGLNTTFTLTPNNANTRTYYGELIKPTLNAGGSNSNKTFNVLAVDTTNTATTGFTVNLLNLAYGGAAQFTVTSGGAVTATSFSGDGSALTSLNGSNVSSGTVADARLSSNVVLENAANTWSTGAQDFGSATSLKIPTSGGAAPTTDGFIAYDSTAKAYVGSAGSATITLSAYDISGSVTSKPGSSQVVLRVVLARAVQLFTGTISNGTNATVKAGTAATAQTDFTVAKVGTGTICTLRFAASGTQATYQSCTSTAFSAGDVLTITAPGTQDSTLADIGFTIPGRLGN